MTPLRMVSTAAGVVCLTAFLVTASTPASSSIRPRTTVAVTILPTAVRFSRAYAPVGTVVFRIRNATSEARAFSIGGRSSQKIDGMTTTSLVVTLNARRGYGYAVSPGSAPGLKGYFNVVEPCTRPIATTVRVTLTTDSIVLSPPKFACGKVTFIVTNDDPSVAHDFSVDTSLLGAGGHVVVGRRLAPGQTASQSMTFAFHGNIYYFSSQPQDSENGLAGYLAIR